MLSKIQLIFLGGPGSGKGTQSKILVEKDGFHHVSTGDLLRDEVKKGTELGKQVDQIMKNGQLVSDDIVFRLLEANCDLSKGAYIFDGFPRNIDQAKLLDSTILKSSMYRTFLFDCREDVLLKRLTSRRVCSACGFIYNMLTSPPPTDGVCSGCKTKSIVHRKDDQEETIRERLKVYNKTIEPVKKYYEAMGKLVVLDASISGQETYKELKKVLSEIG